MERFVFQPDHTLSLTHTQSALCACALTLICFCFCYPSFRFSPPFLHILCLLASSIFSPHTRYRSASLGALSNHRRLWKSGF